MGMSFSSSYFCCSSSESIGGITTKRTRRRTRKSSSVYRRRGTKLDGGETFGNSFTYGAPVSPPQSPPIVEVESKRNKLHHSGRHRSSSISSSFKFISGASVSANGNSNGCMLESSSSFSSLPLHLKSDRGFFLSGPIERRRASFDDGGGNSGVSFSGPITLVGGTKKKVERRIGVRNRSSSSSFFLRRSSSERSRRPSVVPIRSGGRKRSGGFDRKLMSGGGDDGMLQWAHGQAGEDRVHIVLSEENQWLFVGIYDGFNGSDAPEFLVHNLYLAVSHQLKLALQEEQQEQEAEQSKEIHIDGDNPKKLHQSGHFISSLLKMKNSFGSYRKDSNWVQFPNQGHDHNQQGGNDSSDRVNSDGQRSHTRMRSCSSDEDHELVLRALSTALETVEVDYLKRTEAELDRHPELALNGSCALVVFVRDDDVYAMNLGDSRVLVARVRIGDEKSDFKEAVTDEQVNGKEEEMMLTALQLTVDHCTSNAEEVTRIREEHPDDVRCIFNDRVKGRVKLTRAFGAGYLKQPELNDGLLKIFRNDYIGTAPYISSSPSLYHHKLEPNDKFLVLSSDGLYQYLTNDEVVSRVECFMRNFPDGDPAQSLIEEVLLRAADNAGMELHALLDIPQGERRKYHDDVTVTVISVEGKIWKSSGQDLTLNSH